MMMPQLVVIWGAFAAFAILGTVVLATRSRWADARAYRRRTTFGALGYTSRSSQALYHLRYACICGGAAMFGLGLSPIVTHNAAKAIVTLAGATLLIAGIHHTMGPPAKP